MEDIALSWSPLLISFGRVDRDLFSSAWMKAGGVARRERICNWSKGAGADFAWRNSQIRPSVHLGLLTAIRPLYIDKRFIPWASFQIAHLWCFIQEVLNLSLQFLGNRPWVMNKSATVYFEPMWGGRPELILPLSRLGATFWLMRSLLYGKVWLERKGSKACAILIC